MQTKWKFYISILNLNIKCHCVYGVDKSLCAFYSDESRGILERGPYPRYSILLHSSCVWLECKEYRVRSRWSRYLLMWFYTLLMLSVIVIIFGDIVIRCCHSHIVGAIVISCLWNNVQMLIFSILVKYLSVIIWMSLQMISALKDLLTKRLFGVSTRGLFSQFKRLYFCTYLGMISTVFWLNFFCYVHTFGQKFYTGHAAYIFLVKPTNSPT